MKKILFSLLAILLLSGCEFNLKENDNEKDPVEENKITELSVESNEVKNIVDTFIKPSEVWLREGEQYVNENLSDIAKYGIIKIQAKQFVKEDKNCDSDKYSNLDVIYECEYISYVDLNNTYHTLFGGILPKEELDFSVGKSAMYNSELDVFEFVDVATGGDSIYGDAGGKLSKLIKAEQDNKKIYIYEKVLYYADPAYFEGLNFVMFPHNKLELKISSDKSYEEFKQELLTKYLSKFDTYKWTFKKNANGTYMFESIEYVEQ